MNSKGGLTIVMKTFSIVAAVIATTLFVSCQKQQTEAERNAEVERQVQERLAAEHQAQQQQQLAQRQAELDAREKALAEKENTTPAPQTLREQAESEESRPRAREPRERAISVGYSTFYNKLDPYGDWIETGDYGYVFHPRQAQSSRWRPYTDGRWVYTDAGWTWISEEPFGWATYHYGRWTRLRGIGWVWVPGNQWAPAWVSWRKSPDYVGWAPLPPEARFEQRIGIHNWSDNYYDVGPDQYCFVASREFGAPRVEQTLLPSERNVTIINQTTNVTNITYNNTTIVNEGPSYDELRSVSREPVQRYRLERNVNVDLVGAPRPEVRGETVVVAAPVIAAPVANERPQTVKQTITTAAVDLGWAAITNQDEAKKARQKMKAEAAPPSNAPSKKFVKAEVATSTTTQAVESPATTTSATPTVAPTAAATTTAATTSAPASTMTPHRAVTAAPSATVYQSSTPMTSPTPSQRRGRLLVPNARPTPRATASVPQSTPIATPQATASNSPVASETAPSVSPPQTKGGSTGKGAKLPHGATPPTQSASETSESSPSAASTSSTTPAEKLTKQEKKEQKREEKREMKRERREGNAPTSPSPTP